MRLSIFWRLMIGSLALIVLLAGISFYFLSELRHLTALSKELVSYHYPAIETAKRLLSSLYSQLRSEKKYLAVGDAVFVAAFDEEAEEFRQALLTLQAGESSPEGQKLLKHVQGRHDDYHDLFHALINRIQNLAHEPATDYEIQRDATIAQITEALQAYVSLHEARVNELITESGSRSAQAERIMQHLVLAALLLGLGFAALGAYSILRPLWRLQEHIYALGQGRFGLSLNVTVPSDLKQLVDTVNWMGKRLLELDNMKADFVAQLSHELRTPLASVREGTQLLLEEIPGSLTLAQRETLQIIHDSSERLIHTVSTLLDLSKAEAGMMDYQIVPTDLKRIAQASIKKLQMLAKARQIQVCLDVPQGQVWAPIDRERMEQVFDNLLSNALKFSPAQGAVTLRMVPDVRAGVVQVSVLDTGPGIPPEDLPHIFQRFYQGRKHASSTVAGTGLGLALAKNVIEAHGGRIWAQSEPGKGTALEFILPLDNRPAGVA